MVQQSSVFSKAQLGKQIAQVLGQALSEQELSNYIKQIQFIEPKVGKRFWEAADAAAGIYVILAGKVRLLDSTDNLIASIGTGASFGELTLFPEEHLQPYAARASANLKLCYLGRDLLQDLSDKYPSIREHVHQQAILRDLLLLCRQTPILRDTPVQGLMNVLFI